VLWLLRSLRGGQENAPGFVDKFIRITALSDSPDPFSAPVKGSCAISATYCVRVNPGDNPDGKSPQTKFTRHILQSVTMKNATGQVVRTLETRVQLPEPSGKKPAPETQEAQVSTTWDGRTDAGELAPDGVYGYSVKGTYYRIAQTPGSVKEHVFGVTSESAGDLTMDNTPPVLSASQDPSRTPQAGTTRTWW
jgi:hypothetical protein